jgi:hypothetical protein
LIKLQGENAMSQNRARYTEENWLRDYNKAMAKNGADVSPVKQRTEQEQMRDTINRVRAKHGEPLL